MIPSPHRKRIYLDTSIPSALFDERTPERKRMTETFWELLPYHDVFISTLVQEEINSASGSLREKLKEKIRDFTVLEITTDADELAQDYIEQSIFSERYSNDALHVAIAVIHRIEYLISWNFTHLVKVKTRQSVNLLNSLKRYPQIEIIAPPEL